MAPLFEFDPTSEDAANSPLEIWATTNYAVAAFSAPAPPLDVQWAGTVDTEGTLPVSRKYQNRTLTLTVYVVTAAALRTLQAKLAKIAREGGTAKQTFPNGEVIIWDLHATDTYEPQLDITYYTNTGTFCTVNMTLTAAPLGRGPEITTLSDHVETTLPALVFTETGLKGDMPGLGRLVIDNDDATNTQQFLVWGLQSRYYSSASSAALFYQAESCAMGAAVVATGPAGASGGASNNTAYFNSLIDPASYTSLIAVGPSYTAQTHVGSFRVFVRAWAPGTNIGTVSLALNWYPGLGGTGIINDPVPLVDAVGNQLIDQWVLVDLGTVSIPKALSGSTQGWAGYVYGTTSAPGFPDDDIYLDWVMLVPVLEGSGQYSDPTTSSPQVLANGSVHVRHDGAFVTYPGGYLPALQHYEGDYLLIPPAGLESRTLRFIVKMARDSHPGIGNTYDGVYLDPGIDDLSAKLYYTPRYLAVPDT